MKFWKPWSVIFCLAMILVITAGPVLADSSTFNWTPQTSGTTNYLNNVFFSDDSHGWATGASNTLLHTVNAGAVWSSVTIPGLQPTDGHNSVRFVNADTGFVTGIRNVVRTTDGGATWHGFRDANASNARSASFPVSTNVIWVVGASGTNRAYWRVTFDSETSFSTFFYSPMSVGLMNDVYFVSESEGWAVGTGGVITHITNAASGSPSFNGQTSNTSETLNAIFMADTSNGWVVGANGTILKSTDGGQNWVPKNSGTTTALNGVHFTDTLHGWAVGAGGLVLRTEDGGDTWEPETSGTAMVLKSIFVFADGTAYAVGQSGTILKREGLSYVYIPTVIR